MNKPGMIDNGIDRASDYDLVVIGGAYSGSSTAVLIKRRFPDLKVLIVERSEVFSRKVGESTSEVAACFLTRVLRVGQHLQKHVYKHGLRMWFHRDAADSPGRSTEVGPKSQGKLPTFQLNRARLDTELLENAATLGCEIVRPATIKNIELNGVGKNKISYKSKTDDTLHEVTADWVIDASGKASLISKLRKTWRSNTTEHPTCSMWSRFTNVRHLDSIESSALMVEASNGVFSERGFSTNHLMGFGWWAWIIPLDTGEVSIGLTWDQRLFTPPSDGSMSERILTHLLKHPVGKVMFENAEAVPNDNNYYKGLSYYSEEVAGDGWLIVGDAAGFLDPLYSQGLDFCSHTVYSSYALLRDFYSGKCIKKEIEQRNYEYERCIRLWFTSIYHNKYWYLGDAQLMLSAYLLDISSYFLGPVNLVYSDQDREFSHMPFNGKIGGAVALFMTFYNKRLVTLAKKKIRAGKYGNYNLNRSYLISDSFTPAHRAIGHLIHGILVWFRAEISLTFVKPVSLDDISPSTMTPLPQTRDN
ncbi:NAD(P)/FAD-dependent oxidoreductase [Rubritalea sp.]|uniref:NAD(P)/FAD-dependent oxidoreductase n=1 Tax=Rubritalea sp. TaxID=2109375 RepID=UPI003EF118FC